MDRPNADLLRRQRAAALTLALALGACNAAEPAPGTGGVDVSAGPCGRGLVVVASDYQSVNVALFDTEGGPLSPSFISSADRSPSLSAALGGDTVLPSASATGTELVLIDRYPNSVLTWVDFATARVTRQVSVATGFVANPHDYTRVSDTKAYVTRFEPNFDPDREAFDGGSDIVILDGDHSIAGRIDLGPVLAGEDAAYLPHPDRAALLGDRLFVLLGAYTADFRDALDSRLVTIDTTTDRVLESVVLTGLRGCTRLLPSPDGGRLAIACVGQYRSSQLPNPEYSGLVVLDTVAGLAEVARLPASELGHGALSGGFDWIDAERLLVTSTGNFEEGSVPASDDTLFTVELASAAVQVLLRSAGTPFTLGDVRCTATCGRCYVADAGRAAVHRYVLEPDGTLGSGEAIHLNDGIGLPPRYLGWF